MTGNTPDPFTEQARAAYAEDQADAQSRDQQSWELNIRNGEAQAMLSECHAMLEMARARLRGHAATAVTLLTLAAIVLAFLTAFGVTTW